MPAARGSVSILLFVAISAACSSSYVTRDAGFDEGGLDAGIDAAPDAGDAGSCVPVSVQTVPQHGGSACPLDGSACFPGDVTTFSPRWVPPVSGAPHAGVCTPMQIADALADCFGSTESNAACNTWKATTANLTCYGCLTTDVGASRYGALLSAGAYSQLNFAGCIALAEPCNQPCATSILADFECNLTACNPSNGPCAVTDQASLSRENACVAAADATCGCAGFGGAVQCFGELQAVPMAHPAVALCALGSSDFNAGYTAVSTFMCGP
jgi:hypothetical protein